MKRPLILVTGATGTVGREVVRQLIEGGHRVRALVRDPAKMNIGEPVDVVKGDLARPETLAAAFAGVERAFVLSNGLEIAKLEGHAFDAARAAGVGLIVKLSAQESFMDHMAGTLHGQEHIDSEQRLRDSGLSWTMLRPSYFASNLLLWGFVDREQGAIFVPTGSGREAPVDPRDLAAVAVKALTEPGHEGQVYELTGPELLSYGEMMEKLSAVIGKPFKHVDVTESETRRNLLAIGFPPPFADAVLHHYAAVKAGQMRIASGVQDVLGHQALTFDDWVRTNAAALN